MSWGTETELRKLMKNVLSTKTMLLHYDSRHITVIGHSESHIASRWIYYKTLVEVIIQRKVWKSFNIINNSRENVLK